MNEHSLNYKKSNCVVFTQDNCNTFKDFCFMTNNGITGAKNVVRYSGVLIDSIKTWEYYAQFIIDKLCKAKGILSKLRHHAPISVLRNVYYGITYSHLH